MQVYKTSNKVMLDKALKYGLLLDNFYLIAIDVNVQVYKTSNKVMNILHRLHSD